MTSQSISIELPKPEQLLSAKGWTAFLLALIVICAVAPALNLLVPEGSALHLSDYMVGLLGKFMCYAICALAIDLIWGYTGILSLGHGLFFALGGYVMGMYLMREAAGPDALPAFMGFLDWKALPWHWALSGSFVATVLLVFLVPGLIGGVFGYFAFRSRIKGVYFSIITQALTYAAMLLFFRNETGFGGNNGFTGFKSILGYSINTQGMHVLLFALSGLALLACFLFSRWLICSKYGRVLQAVRDAETRTMFCGYNPLPYKLSIWVISAMMCGLAGALYVPQVGIINPSEMSVGNSIEMAVWTAVGGRASLVGPIMGAFVVNGGKSWLTVAAPEYWLYVLGALFIVVTLFMPGGLIRLPQQIKQWNEKRKAQSTPSRASDAVVQEAGTASSLKGASA
ncbi:urea ABC transporter permease subunit UrtC [Comamonas testosteroni]|uniref:Urea ABC transporter permease subunit UrtC n=1 Tax=Comamonas testosteroni TaxID=285 RepID=A0A373FFP0_COMTE|nr:urea ABC transporter permease subunit UrtC [Comamonas testosteroni]RGE42968.1 urea ABC transporter permease subunit UrtC [Comamonas testosteroni]